MKIGNLIIGDKWSVKNCIYSKSITILPKRYSICIDIVCIDNMWFIYFPDLIPELLVNYRNMFKLGKEFSSANKAKERVDLFLNKLSKLKAFL